MLIHKSLKSVFCRSKMKKLKPGNAGRLTGFVHTLRDSPELVVVTCPA